EAWDKGDAIDKNAGGISLQEMVHTMLVTALGPVISHELGHLEHGHSGQLAASGLLGMTSAATQRDAERQADLYAAQFIERRLEELQRKTGRNEQWFYLQTQPLFWFVKLLRESALAEVFEGLRGMDARDALMNIEHRGCIAAPTIYPINAGDF